MARGNSRVGEDHPLAILTDAEVELIRALRDELGLSYRDLAAKFECSARTVAAICRFERRRIRVIDVHVQREMG